MMKYSKAQSFTKLAVGLAVALLVATGCRTGGTPPAPPKPVTAEPLVIGVFQIVEHPAVDALREGFVEVLPEGREIAGRPVQYDIQNAHGDSALFDQIAGRFVANKVDLVYVLGTPCAQAIAAKTTGIPIVLGGATDPVAAGLADSWDAPGRNVTGTSDLPPVEAHFDMLQELLPKARRVGVVYNSGEVNSTVVVDRARRLAGERSLELVERSVANTAEVPDAAASLLGKCDVIYITTDNTVAAALPALMQTARNGGVPVFGCTGDSAREGAIFALTADYTAIGRLSARMALEILNGREPATMPIRLLDKPSLVLNLDSARALGIAIPESLLARADEVIDSQGKDK